MVKMAVAMETVVVIWVMAEVMLGCVTSKLLQLQHGQLSFLLCASYIEFCSNVNLSAPKNWYLGWYEELHEEYNPLEESSKLFQMVGLSDYQDALASANSSSYTTVLRIETFEEESLYLTYNRKKGVNIDTKEFEDKVTIVRAEGSCQSWVEAGLAAGKRYARAIVRGSGLSVEIVVCDMIAGSPDYAVRQLHQDVQKYAYCRSSATLFQNFTAHQRASFWVSFALHPT